jgi:RNA polymerase sigma-70 factor (ECF subfamily)
MDSELIQKLKNWDNRAWREFLNEYDGFIKSIMRRVLKDKQDTEDCYQDLMFKLSSKLTSYRTGEPFKRWFYKVVHRHAVKYLKKLDSVKIIKIPFDDTILEHAVNKSRTPESDLISQETRNAIFSAIETLEHRRPVSIFLMYHFHEMSYREIADLFPISVENARNMVSRGKKILEKLLEKEYGD